MQDELGNWIVLLVVVFVAVMMLTGAFNMGSTVENTRLYRKCLVEQQDRTHKEAVDLCKERVKE